MQLIAKTKKLFLNLPLKFPFETLTNFHPETPSPLAGPIKGEGKKLGFRMRTNYELRAMSYELFCIPLTSLPGQKNFGISNFMEETRYLYLKAGDWVVHHKYPEWGVGIVVEERNSPIQGGASYVKVTFRDGQTRIFDNNFRNATCCYHAGLRRR